MDNLIDFDGAIYLEVYRERKPRIWFTQTGEIYRDGVSLNEKYGYDEAFGMSVLDGEISFFFKQEGRIGFRWGDLEQLLPFDEIDIDRLSILDRPYSFTKAKAFYAKSGYQWYYAVLNRSGEK